MVLWVVDRMKLILFKIIFKIRFQFDCHNHNSLKLTFFQNVCFVFAWVPESKRFEFHSKSGLTAASNPFEPDCWARAGVHFESRDQLV